MYEITEVQDVSRINCKRFVAHINVDTNDKDLVKHSILSATLKIKSSEEYASEVTKQRFDCPAHVVRLYVHFGEKLICQSMWVDKRQTEIVLPKLLNYNDWNGDIGIVWGGVMG